jgi:ubiquinone/menaquinone biosynthesis C-methylase UbiE
MGSSETYDGVWVRVAAAAMARMNRAAEIEAIDILDPQPESAVLAIGIGPGIGVEAAAGHPAVATVAGVDPSHTMVRLATKRNRRAIERGSVDIVRTTASSLPWPDATFDGAIAVNSVHVWAPIDESVAEVARTLRPGARLVALTHRWAIERRGRSTVATWFRSMSATCEAHGLVDPRMWRARAERGRSVAFTVTKQCMSSRVMSGGRRGR